MLNLTEIRSFFSEKERSFPENMIREYLQYLILDAIFSSKYGSRMKFIGGTCIKIIYGGHRFSEDLDFDNDGFSLKEFNDLAKLVKQFLEKEGFAVELKVVSKGAFRCIIKLPGLLYGYGLETNKRKKLNIFIDTTHRSFKVPAKTMIINKFGVYREIRSQPIDIILSQKIIAFLKRPRTKGRDIYDIVYLWSKTKPNFEYLSAQKKSLIGMESLLTAMEEAIKDKNVKDLTVDVKAFLPNKKEIPEIKYFHSWLKQKKEEI